MKTLFDQTKLSGMKMKNRFFRSATHDGRADLLGNVTEKLICHYEEHRLNVFRAQNVSEV